MNLCEGIDENQEGAFSRFQFSILSFPFSIFNLLHPEIQHPPVLNPPL